MAKTTPPILKQPQQKMKPAHHQNPYLKVALTHKKRVLKKV